MSIRILFSTIAIFIALACWVPAKADLYSCPEGGHTVIRDTPCNGKAPSNQPPLNATVESRLAAVQANAILGRVVSISDGDTLALVDATNRRYKIRLAEIDAPEKKQPFGSRSKQSLAEMCFGVDAQMVPATTDRYGRTVGKVYCKGVDVNAEQVRLGMAWVYEQYAKDRGLRAIQSEARQARRGLWVDPDPVAPWEWRSARRTGQ